jgi:2-polyprenyl-6-methoxyphenol hydroxylase-like FAD-dependent oxidoreductase
VAAGSDTQLVVVGGGPVGLAAAILARQSGVDVAVIEPRTGPIDKACGEGLMPGALAWLERLGVQADGAELRGVAYVQGGLRAEHRFAGGPVAVCDAPCCTEPCPIGRMNSGFSASLAGSKASRRMLTV